VVSLSTLNRSNIGVGKDYSTVKDLMIPTPTRLKYIPILKFSSRVTLKKGKTLNQNYSDFEIQIIQDRLFSF
tara:strand:- start:602 stop:817 length:216 start_codon:yes stop_codon:yes gene_type:complete